MLVSPATITFYDPSSAIKCGSAKPYEIGRPLIRLPPLLNAAPAANDRIRFRGMFCSAPPAPSVSGGEKAPVVFVLQNKHAIRHLLHAKVFSGIARRRHQTGYGVPVRQVKPDQLLLIISQRRLSNLHKHIFIYHPHVVGCASPCAINLLFAVVSAFSH